MINVDNLSLNHKMNKIYGNFKFLKGENTRIFRVHTLKYTYTPICEHKWIKKNRRKQ